MLSPMLLPQLLNSIACAVNENAEEVTALDQAIGDGDHVFNLQRGINALLAQSDELSQLEWPAAFQKMGMTLMSTVGGASGSLFGTLFVAMAKAAKDKYIDSQGFAVIFRIGVDSMKLRGKSDVGEKTMLDVLIPVVDYLQQAGMESVPMSEVYEKVCTVAIDGMESTRDMLATKGRASFLGDRTLGHIDAGAKTCQLMICAIAKVLSTSPA